jgi:hypothetical protein
MIKTPIRNTEAEHRMGEGSCLPGLTVTLSKYNEKELIAGSPNGLTPILAMRTNTAEIILIDDSSSDRTAHIDQQLQPHLKCKTHLKCLALSGFIIYEFMR